MCGQNPWPTGTEPSIDELLSDPIVLALLRSDGLDRRSVEAILARARRAATCAATASPRPAGRTARLRQAREPAAPLSRARIEFDFDAEPELTLSEN